MLQLKIKKKTILLRKNHLKRKKKISLRVNLLKNKKLNQKKLNLTKQKNKLLLNKEITK